MQGAVLEARTEQQSGFTPWLGQHEPLPSSYRLSHDGVGQGLSWSPQGLFSFGPREGAQDGQQGGEEHLPYEEPGHTEECHVAWGGFSLVPLPLVLHILSLV